MNKCLIIENLSPFGIALICGAEMRSCGPIAASPQTAITFISIDATAAFEIATRVFPLRSAVSCAVQLVDCILLLIDT